MNETQYKEKKSLKLFTGNKPDWRSLAKDCVCFANAHGGIIIIGIENKEEEPPINQKILDPLAEQIRKRISELTINVAIDASIKKVLNGGEYIELKILPSPTTVASTTEGQYYIRISNHCKPVLPDELQRLFTDKPAFIWETKVVQKITIKDCDQNKLNNFIDDIKQSNRTSEFVKNKNTDEILTYYQLTDNQGFLTNLGILWVGTRQQRARLLYAPVVQFIKYDEQGNKVNKQVWDDYGFNPKELIENIWNKIPDWKEGIEISEGIFGRKTIAHYNENVIRELLTNALVHRPYTTRGDIFINLYSHRLEIHNPGLLPLGVTPQNILHQTVQRNQHLAKIFYDLNLMEREGGGYDKMYEIQLIEGKQPPVVQESNDRVEVTLFKQIKNQDAIQLVEKIKKQYPLNQKEIICLGIIAQSESIIATEFFKQLQVRDEKQIKNWLGKLLDHQIVKTKGKTKGTTYFINPDILRETTFAKTNLRNIEEHRLKELILQDIANYPNSSIQKIHARIGQEIPIRRVQKTLYNLVNNSTVKTKGGKKFRKYFIFQNEG